MRIRPRTPLTGAAVALATVALLATSAQAGYKRLGWTPVPGPVAAAPAGGAAAVGVVTAAATLIPTTALGAGAAAVRTSVYVAGGATGTCAVGSPSTASRAVSVFSTTTGTWSRGPSMRVPRAHRPLVGAVGGLVYVVGGTSDCLGTTARRTERLDPATGVWTVLPASADLPAALDGVDHCGATVGRSLVTFQRNGIGVLDTATQTWRVLRPSRLLATSTDCAAAVVRATDGTLRVVVTGVGTSRTSVLSFDPASLALTALPVTTPARTRHVAFGLGSQVALAGGQTRTRAVHVVETTTPMTVAALGELPASRLDSAGVTVAGRFYLVAGRSGNDLHPPVLVGTPVF